MQVPDATPAPSHHRQEDVAINRSLSIRHMHHPVKAVRRATLVSAPEQWALMSARRLRPASLHKDGVLTLLYVCHA